jgi:hypothetical protein
MKQQAPLKRRYLQAKRHIPEDSKLRKQHFTVFQSQKKFTLQKYASLVTFFSFELKRVEI